MLKRIHYNSPVILTLTFLSFGVLVLSNLTNKVSDYLLFSVYRSDPKDILFYFRLFGHVLGHVNWEHFINNYLLILVIGPVMEEKYGSKKMIQMILITALITGILNILVSNYALLGASGIVFMLILLSSFVNLQKGKIPLTTLLVAFIFFAREIENAVFSVDNISQLTHIAGGVCGGIFGFVSGNKA
ncbi:MAG: rhomboid family intramembrane serine protease [Clostridiaceae bacterium]|nr:rhomboid family intramembrane serine protease [Clostridiaceae bacterium]